MRAPGEPLAVTTGANVTYDVAVRDTVTGRTTAYRHASGPAHHTHPTASVVKLGILAALLLRAQDTGREPTSHERASAADMIERSDNDAATGLLKVVGGAGGWTPPTGASGCASRRRRSPGASRVPPRRINWPCWRPCSEAGRRP